MSPHGFWLLVGERELFVAFKDFPWFADATIRELREVTRPSPEHLYWNLLDVDLSVSSIEEPARYPLISKVPAGRVREPGPKKRSPQPRKR